MVATAALPESWQPFASDGTLHFDPASHTYTLNGKRVPSVTQVLALAGLVDLRDVPPHILEAARLKGEYVHRACEFLDQDDLDVATLDPALAGYVRAWEKCKAERKLRIVAIERPVSWTDGELAFAGTLDRLTAEAEDQFIDVLDLKSGSRLQPTTALQLAAYRLAAGGEGRRVGVRLCADGAYEWREYESATDRDVFLSALRLAHWRLQHDAKAKRA